MNSISVVQAISSVVANLAVIGTAVYAQVFGLIVKQIEKLVQNVEANQRMMNRHKNKNTTNQPPQPQQLADVSISNTTVKM